MYSLLKGLPTYSLDVLDKTMLDKLQEICVGSNEIDILDLMDKMRKMHTVCGTVPQYVKALQDVQEQAERSENAD